MILIFICVLVDLSILTRMVLTLVLHMQNMSLWDQASVIEVILCRIESALNITGLHE